MMYHGTYPKGAQLLATKLPISAVAVDWRVGGNYALAVPPSWHGVGRADFAESPQKHRKTSRKTSLSTRWSTKFGDFDEWIQRSWRQHKKARFVNWRLSLSAPVGVPCKIGAFCFCLRNKGSTSRVSLKSCQICIFDVGSEDHLRWNNTAKIHTSPTHCTHTGNVQINLNGHKRQCCKVNVQHAKHHKCATENTGILLVSAYVIPHLAVHNPLQNEKTSKCGAELQSCFKGQYVDPQKCFPLPWALSS